LKENPFSFAESAESFLLEFPSSSNGPFFLVIVIHWEKGSRMRSIHLGRKSPSLFKEHAGPWNTEFQVQEISQMSLSQSILTRGATIKKEASGTGEIRASTAL